ncbi:hypothetical protein [Oryzicola mucosus]|uniref:Uncharacterized protein n=1 Tax=Oryzicola mucosus TaxID=2767425 RepID=A0A8J6Q198_9HYPH|nr:hypothetical protein [Oryzicola mucosus]MBD0414500.1 hypothetical protein [Oryzicola mucosus]
MEFISIIFEYIYNTSLAGFLFAAIYLFSMYFAWKVWIEGINAGAAEDVKIHLTNQQRHSGNTNYARGIRNFRGAIPRAIKIALILIGLQLVLVLLPGSFAKIYPLREILG